VVLARAEADALKHNYIGTEHLLLGLLREEGVAARVLESLEVTPELARAGVERIVGSGEKASGGQSPFTPGAKRALERAVRESLSLGNDHVRPAHILLGLVGDDEGVANRILLDCDADPLTIRNRLMLMLPDASSTPRRFAQAGADIDVPVIPELADTATDIDLGWRERPIALAALGAAVLARSAFDSARTGPLRPLEMQLLVQLALGSADWPLAESGQLFQSLTTALACSRDDLRDVIRALEGQELIVVRPAEGDDQQISITATGVAWVHQWLGRCVSLFGQWPPDHPDADDVTS
jgi:hypothetical protein